MARGSPASDRDQRSLARQLAEDVEIIEVEEGVVVKDYGDGVSKFLDSSESDNCGPGFSVNQDTRKESEKGPGLSACDFPGPPRTPRKKKSPNGEEEEEEMGNEEKVEEPDLMTPLLQALAQ